MKWNNTHNQINKKLENSNQQTHRQSTINSRTQIILQNKRPTNPNNSNLIFPFRFSCFNLFFHITSEMTNTKSSSQSEICDSLMSQLRASCEQFVDEMPNVNRNQQTIETDKIQKDK